MGIFMVFIIKKGKLFEIPSFIFNKKTLMWNKIKRCTYGNFILEIQPRIILISIKK
jgi:hypothetical protein